MAKATLEFDLNDPDDKMAHLRCVKSTDMAIALFEIEMNLKKKMERELEAKEMRGETVDPYDSIQMIMDYIFETIHENGINIEELIN